jgi:glycosyltransferase involved in cell wall biosynthesis
MDNDKTVSIIIPCYNCEKYISEAIESILKQTYEHIQIIIVDAGSADESIKILKNYERDNKITLLQQNHAGVSAARNLGLKVASGTYIFFMDADDKLHNECIRRLVQCALENNSDMVVIRKPYKFTGNIKRQKITTNSHTISGTMAALEQLAYKIVIASWGRLYKNSILKDNKIAFVETLKYGEGFNFSVEAMLKSKSVTIIDDQLYYYRVNSSTSVMSTLRPGMVENSIFAIERIKTIIPKTKPFNNAINYALFHTACDMLNTIEAVDPKNKTARNKVERIIKRTKVHIKELKLPKKEQAKIVLYKTLPTLSAKFINRMRKRRYYET